MSEQTPIEIVTAAPVDPLIDAFLTQVGFGFNPGAMRRACRREVLRLNAKSDAELCVIGLRRADIPAHVLRHRLPAFAP